ncbi:MAG: glycosyltransferase family 4 protein [Clostridiales bacterium]|nr:glycosyltransferase family 4 protein [Clostridiales bacterium]
MKVLMLAHESSLNGASKSLLNLIDTLSDVNEYYVAIPFLEGPMVEELKKRDVTIIHYSPVWWFNAKPKNFYYRIKNWLKWILQLNPCNKKVALDLKKEVEKYGIEIIHSNVSIINIGGLLKELTGIPLVWHIREFGQEDFSIYTLPTVRGFFKMIDKNADAVVTVSNALRDKYAKRLKKNTPITIYNGIDKENLNFEKQYKNNDVCNFLIAGAIQEPKGQHIAIGAVNKLLDRGYTNFKLYIAGAGDMDWLNKSSVINEEHIEVLGRVEDMFSLRKRINVELVCSKSEAFGRVTAEAMMGGIPVIGSNSGGTPELVEDGKSGFLFPVGDISALADKMEVFLNNPDKIETMGRYAQKVAENRFSIERCAREVQDVYNSVRLNKNT